ncbi:haloacid dehalogenase-like hydrolase [bacterium]|nr:haloacid dehalogenase-like hydrolase [bacterium]
MISNGDSRDYEYFLDKCALSNNALSELESRVSQLPADISPILDFDHTLLLGNSTEIFLLSVRPRLWGEIIDKTVRIAWNRFGTETVNEIDRWRVLAAIFAAPWSLPCWKVRAHSEVDLRWNHSLEKVVSSGRKAPIIISFGFKQLIEPLIEAKSCQNSLFTERPILICSDIFKPSLSIRRHGKISGLERYFPEIVWSKYFSVSDSEEDRDLLLRSRNGFYIQWHEPDTVPRPGYIPFRFLRQAKFRGRSYFKNYILQQDLVVWLFIYAFTYSQALPAFFFFLSLHSIYEIGYYENDYIAAKTEQNPTLFFELSDFECYPIGSMAWIFALLTGLLGIFALYNSFHLQSLAAWFLILIALRLSFYIYNRQSPNRRLPYYLLLQTLKNFGGLFVMNASPIGLALAMGHAFQHVSVYQIYRCGGDKKQFPRRLMRAVTFVLGVFVLYSVGTSLNIIWFAFALIWCIYQVVQEKFGCKSLIRKTFKYFIR